MMSAYALSHRQQYFPETAPTNLHNSWESRPTNQHIEALGIDSLVEVQRIAVSGEVPLFDLVVDFLAYIDASGFLPVPHH